MKLIVAVATVILVVATACSSASEPQETTTVAFVGSSDAETAWCGDFNNFPTIARAAISEEVEGFEVIEAEQVRIIDGLGESFLESFIGGFLELEWRPANPQGYAAACTAAFSSR
ncbi:MAG: hypothetical protein M3132_02585 [Actinomycetia bacterium]|nr:hypothetical protein [Actinomycetes bacterium]